MFQIWYEANKYRWAISRKTGGKQNPLMYLDVSYYSYYRDETKAFTYNAKGTKLWTVVDGQLSIKFYVSVKCSPKKGKIFL